MVRQKKFFGISNRFFYTLITLGIIIILGVGVYAVAQLPGPNPGHLITELQACSPGETIVTNSNNQWACTPASSGGGGGNSPWTISGSNIYYTAGAVGIGTSTPGAALDVVGWLRSQGVRVNTLNVDNQLCFGTDCKSSWTQTQTNYGAVPSTFLKKTDNANLGISNDIQNAIDAFSWQNIRYPNSVQAAQNCPSTSDPAQYALCRQTQLADGGVSQVYTETIPLDPSKGAIVGLSLEGSSADDSGICVAGFPGYFFIAATHNIMYAGAGNSFGNGNVNDVFNNLGLDGNFTLGTNSGGLTWAAGGGSGQLKRWNWLMPNLAPGGFKFNDCSLNGGWVWGLDLNGCAGYEDAAYTKAAGVTYAPPGSTLVVKGQYANGQGASSIMCNVSVIYAPQSS